MPGDENGKGVFTGKQLSERKKLMNPFSKEQKCIVVSCNLSIAKAFKKNEFSFFFLFHLMSTSRSSPFSLLFEAHYSRPWTRASPAAQSLTTSLPAASSSKVGKITPELAAAASASDAIFGV